MNVFAPKNKYELYDILKFSRTFDEPLAIRYPRGMAYEGLKKFRAPIAAGKSEVLYEGKDVAILAVGSMVQVAEDVRIRLMEAGITPTVVNVRFVKPVDRSLIISLAASHKLVVTMEENVLRGGFGEQVDALLARENSVSCENSAISECSGARSAGSDIGSGGNAQTFDEYSMDGRGGGKIARTLNFGIPDVYVEHGNVDFLKATLGLDAASVNRKNFRGI